MCADDMAIIESIISTRAYVAFLKVLIAVGGYSNRAELKERKGFRMMVFGRFLPAGVQNHYVSTRGKQQEENRESKVHTLMFFVTPFSSIWFSLT